MKLLLAACFLFALGNSVLANECSEPYFAGTLPEHEVRSVTVTNLESYLLIFPTAEGIKFDLDIRENELWIDIIEYPGDVTAIAGTRILFIIGRIADGDFGSLILADDGKGLYRISEEDIRAIGCQFVWGVEGKGQNPIALIRQFADSLKFYDSGRRVASRFTGSLLGDTTASMDMLNAFVVPNWILTAVKID